MISTLAHPHLRRSMALLLSALAVLVVMVVLFVVEAQKIIHGENVQLRINLVLPPLRELLADLQDGESGQRGYLLTGDASYLLPFERARLDADIRLAQVRSAIPAGDTTQHRRLDRLAELKTQKFAELEESIVLAQQGQRNAAIALMRDSRGRQLMAEARVLLDSMISDLKIERTAINTATQGAVRRAVYIFICVGLLLALAVAMATRLLLNVVEANIALSARLENEATHDSLTGLANRRLLHQWLPPLLQQARRRGSAVAVLYIDLDGFKQVNDRLGHAAGDAVLLLVAQRAATVLRGSDLLVRLGGDEFAVVVGDAGPRSDLELLAQRLLQAISQPLPGGFQGNAIGASIGVARFPEHGVDADTILSRADDAMYHAKHGGKGRVCFADTRMPQAAAS
jgi:diguanylate cyclase (GGDEF)-like protein